MRLAKAFARRKALQRAFSGAAAQYIRLVHATSRWTVKGGETPRHFWAEGKPFILAFWHGRLLLMPYCWNRSVPINMLISGHRDGRLIARTMGYFGIATVQGSSTKGGGAALRALLRSLQGGTCVGFTPDGPRGPRMRANMGVVNAARLANAAILPCAYSIRRGRLLGSWDRFLLALPLSRGVFVWGAPITVAPDADAAALEATRQRVEASLNAVTREADLLCGRQPVEPEPSRAAPTQAAAQAVAGGS